MTPWNSHSLVVSIISVFCFFFGGSCWVADMGQGYAAGCQYAAERLTLDPPPPMGLFIRARIQLRLCVHWIYTRCWGGGASTSFDAGTYT